MADVYKCRMSDYSIVFHLKADSKEQAIGWMRMHTSEDVMRLTSDYSEEYDEEILDIDRTQETADIDISTKETECEVIEPNWILHDEEKPKYSPDNQTIYTEDYNEDFSCINSTQAAAENNTPMKEVEYAIDIEWSVDDEEDLKRLPGHLVIHTFHLIDDMSLEDTKNEEEFEERIVEFLTEKYEYCICGCGITKTYRRYIGQNRTPDLKYHAKGSGDISFSAWNQEIISILNSQFEFDLFDTSNDTRTDICVSKNGNYSETALAESLAKLNPYTIEGDIKFLREDGHILEWYFDQDTKQWVEIIVGTD